MEEKLKGFLPWLKLNGVKLQGCNFKYCNSSKGVGLFASANGVSGDALLVTPLDLAITPMRVLQDPLFGPECRTLVEKGDVDDRLLMILFLAVERIRRNSSWEPYLRMLPTRFSTPLWFTEQEMLELRGTNLHAASKLEKMRLEELYESKVKHLVHRILSLSGTEERDDVNFEDFLWAYSIFWSRGQNIPFPSSYVFQGARRDSDDDKVWVEGIIPGIDFCNHDSSAAALWEVDELGSVTDLPLSMYLHTEGRPVVAGSEIPINYGDKGNEELLFLYGFVTEDNMDDYLMVYCPIEAAQNAPFRDCRGRLLEAQEAELRCLLSVRLLTRGMFLDEGVDRDQPRGYSWSGHRRRPPYADVIVFPEKFMSALRTVAMKESEISRVQSLLEELISGGVERQATCEEVRAAVWEVCGDVGSLSLLVRILSHQLVELEEGTGVEDLDHDLLRDSDECFHHTNKWSSVVYRSGQKQLARLFLKEAEDTLQLALSEDSLP